MSDKPTPKPQRGVSMISLQAAHEKENWPGKIKETSPGVFKMQTPAKGKECGYEKAHNKQENKFNRRGATRVWNKVRPHKPANLAAHKIPKVPEPSTPKKVKPPECASSYDGHKVAGR